MIDYEEDWICSLLIQFRGSVALRASLFAVPAAILGILLVALDEWAPGFREDIGWADMRASQIWNATTICIGILIGFRTRQALSRFWEGTGLLHQMRGEWFDTVSNCVTFSITAKKTKCEQVKRFRHTIVRLMSLAHGSALEEIAGDQVQLETIDIFGLDPGTLRHLKECHEKYKFNKVEVMLHLVQSLITTAHDEGVLKIPPPILSRVYQTISRGFVNLLNAKKITDTRFPFPYAQLIAFLLIAITILTPLMLSALIKSKILVALFTFVPVFGLFSLNFIAIELENPFGIDTNDLPLQHFQDEMNSCLLMLLHDNTDLIAGTSENCMMDFQALYKEICPHLAGISESFEEMQLSRRKTRLSDFKDDSDGGADPDDEPICEVHTSEMDARTSTKDQALLKEGTTTTAATAATVATSSVSFDTAIAAAIAEQPKEQKKMSSLAGVELAEKKDPPPAEPKTAKMPPSLGKNATDPHAADQGPPEAPNFSGMPALQGGALPPHDLRPVLDQSMSDFNRSMQRWTQVIDSQVGELHRNCHALQRFNDSLAELRPANPWEKAVPAM